MRGSGSRVEGAGAVRGTASNRYRTPGPATPGTERRLLGGLSSRADASNQARIARSNGSLGRAGTSTLVRAGVPRLTTRARSAAGSTRVYSTGTYYGAYGASLSFGFGIGYGGYGYGIGLSYGYGYGFGSPWGCYGFPFYYGCYWPYYRYQFYRPFWGGFARYPYYSRLWYWPYSAAYAPISYGTYYSYPTTIVVREESVAEAPVEEVVASGGAPADSLAELADRFVSLGDFYFREGRFAEAAEAYARARTYAPDDATIHFVLADALFAVGDYHFAAFLIAEALRLEPELARAEADKRTFYSDPDVFDRQMDTLARYLADKPYDAAAHLVNGYNLKFSGRSEEAKLAFRRVLEIEAGNQAAKAFLDALEAPAEAAPPTIPLDPDRR